MQKFRYILICLCFFHAGALCVSAQSVSELNSRRQKTEKEIAYINSLLEKNKNQQKSSLNNLLLVQQKIKSRKQLIADIDAQIHLLEKQINGKKERVSGLEHNLDDLQKSYEQLLYQAYKNRDKRLWLMYILSSNDLGVAYRRWQYFKSYSDYINDQALKIQQAKSDLQVEIKSLNDSKDELAQRMKDRQKEVSTMQKEEGESQQIVQNLSGEEKKLRQQMNEKRRVIERLDREIEKIIAEEAKKAAKEQKGGKGMAELPAAEKALSAGFENNRGRLPWPVGKGVVVERFGEHPHAILRGIKVICNGINISTEKDSDVLSVFEGTVTRVFFPAGMQTCVMVKHGEYFTIYCKLQSVNVKAGDKVKNRSVIGKVFTGDETVLHFQIWKGTTKLNPELWLTQ